MASHRRHDHDIDEILHAVSFEPDPAFAKRLRARLGQKLAEQDQSLLWSNGRHPLPNHLTKRDASPGDEEERPMKSTRLLAVFSFGLIAVVVLTLIGAFALQKPGAADPAAAPEEPAAVTDEQPVATQEVEPSSEEDDSDAALLSETVVTEIAEIAGVWRGYDATSRRVVYMENRADGTGDIGQQVDGSGDQLTVSQLYQGGCDGCKLTYNGTDWLMSGYLKNDGSDPQHNAVGRYQIKLITLADGTVMLEFMEIDEPYADRAAFAEDFGPWVRVDLQPNERIVTDDADLVGVWRGYNRSARQLLYMVHFANGTGNFAMQLEWSGDELVMADLVAGGCPTCTLTYRTSAWFMTGYMLEDSRNPDRNAIGVYEIRQMTLADGTVTEQFIPIDDPYTGRQTFSVTFGPWVRLDLQPGENISADPARFTGVWRLSTSEGVLYMQVSPSGSYGSRIDISRSVEGTGDALHVVPVGTDDDGDPLFLSTSQIWRATGLLNVQDQPGVWFEQGDRNRTTNGRYEVRIQMDGDEPFALRFVLVEDSYAGRSYLYTYGAWTRVSLRDGESIVSDVSEIVGRWQTTTADGATLYLQITGDGSYSVTDGSLVLESKPQDRGLDAQAGTAVGPIQRFEIRLLKEGDMPLELTFMLLPDVFDPGQSFLTGTVWTWVAP